MLRFSASPVSRTIACVSIQAQILNLKKDIQETTGISYLLIAHGMLAVQHISNRAGVMYLGKLVERTNAIKIFDSPLHPYTREVKSAVAIPDSDLPHRSLTMKGEIPNLTTGAKDACSAVDVRNAEKSVRRKHPKCVR